MGNGHYLFTSESVAIGHPDKVADQISDAILDEIIDKDKQCRVACETLVTTGMAFVAGEITTSCWVDIPEIVRKTIKEIGYTEPSLGFDYETCAVITSINKQSPDIDLGVSGKGLYKEQGAGDQGMMFGFACRETEELMPMTIMLAHKLVSRLHDVRVSKVLPFLKPDGKSQVTMEYEGRKPIRAHTVLVSAQHAPDVSFNKIKEAIVEEVIKKVIPEEYIHGKTRFLVNPTGRFVIGGPMADTGLTGRKIIVDTYGGRGAHGGGCFSGKDPTKVDRSASYAARWVAKNIVAAELAGECEVQLAYSIGVAHPLSIVAFTNGTNKIPEDRIVELIEKHFDLTPAGIIRDLDLLRPIYLGTARYGHFGRRVEEYTWERLDKVDLLKEDAGL